MDSRLFLAIWCAGLLFFSIAFRAIESSASEELKLNVGINEGNFDDQFRVILDPGHGGSDLGARRDSLIESKVVLAIAEKMRSLLESQVVHVTLTREANQNLSLQQRVQLANKQKAHLFVSLHANWSNSSFANGFEFYFASQKRYFAPQRRYLASPKRYLASPKQNNTLLNSNEDEPSITRRIVEDLSNLGRQRLSLEFSKQTQSQLFSHAPNTKSVIRRAPFFVIENTEMPAVLVEVGFISNRREAKKLADSKYQSEIAEVLVKSILSYRENSSFKEKSDKKVSLNK